MVYLVINSNSSIFHCKLFQSIQVLLRDRYWLLNSLCIWLIWLVIFRFYLCQAKYYILFTMIWITRSKVWKTLCLLVCCQGSFKYKSHYALRKCLEMMPCFYYIAQLIGMKDQLSLKGLINYHEQFVHS